MAAVRLPHTSYLVQLLLPSPVSKMAPPRINSWESPLKLIPMSALLSLPSTSFAVPLVRLILAWSLLVSLQGSFCISSKTLTQPSPPKQLAHHSLSDSAISHSKDKRIGFSGSLLPLAHSPCPTAIPSDPGPPLRPPASCSTPSRLAQMDSPQAPSSEGISGGGGWPGVLVSPAAGVR